MKILLIILLSVFISPVMAVDGINLPKYSKIYDDQRSPFKDATAALALAKETNRQVLIEIGGNWCSWCHKMDTFLSNNPHFHLSMGINTDVGQCVFCG